MNKVKKITLGLAVITFTMLLLAGSAHGYNTIGPEVKTANGASNYQLDQGIVALSPSQMNNGLPMNTPNLYIRWFNVNPSAGEFTIVVTKPSGATITYYDCSSADGIGGIPLTLDQAGQWWIDWYGTMNAHNSVGFKAEIPVFVLPESVIGGLAAIGAGLAAFGIYSVAKAKRPRLTFHSSI